MILANPIYYRDFYYICCDVPDRNSLIKDDDDDEGNDSEQSDIVSLILNLAYIPEYVGKNLILNLFIHLYIAERFNFKTGFSKELKPAMQKYKSGQEVFSKIGAGPGLGMISANL